MSFWILGLATALAVIAVVSWRRIRPRWTAERARVEVELHQVAVEIDVAIAKQEMAQKAAQLRREFDEEVRARRRGRSLVNDIALQDG